VQELGDLPDGLNDMPSIRRVQDWYAQSFDELTTLPRPNLSTDLKERLLKSTRDRNGKDAKILTQATKNPSVKAGQYRSGPENGVQNGNGGRKGMSARRYYVPSDDGVDWPPELNAYNKKFAETLENIKRRHDSVVTTVGMKPSFVAVLRV
jgi:pyruvate dehydrogenase kinase 2/3/4